jgi:Calcineurin-like phosphoesterase
MSLMADLKCKPGMTGWFKPSLLTRLLLNVIVSGKFGQYADRRLIHAALDHVDGDELVRRAAISDRLERDEDGALWIDYVADLGDGFDATYAIAYLLAQESIDVDGHRLPRGQLVVMGGDQVYPDASRKDYLERMRQPYEWAFPDNNDKNAPHPKIFLIPGNHDWYDGLVLFLAQFCRRAALKLGSWRCEQRRSYFAIQLTQEWWLWGIDIQLMEDIDQPQADYFEAIAASMQEGTNIILCTSVPGWLTAEREKKDSYSAMGYVAGIARKEGKDLKVAAVLSGDTHHYSRYSYEEIQFVTSGGGGAFLHGTHQLKDEIHAKWWLRPGGGTFRLKTEPGGNHVPSDKAACYPTREESRRLLSGNGSFYITNWGFSVVLGVIYWLFAAALTLRPEWDTHIIIGLAMLAAFTCYTVFQEGRSAKVIASSLIHALAQFAALVGLTRFWEIVNTNVFGLDGFWTWLAVLGLEIVPTGGMAAGFLFGLYLWLSCRWLDINHNDAFSAMRLDSFRHFLRIRIKDNTLTIFPIGVDAVPSRTGWKENDDPSPPASVFAPVDPIALRLIEGPIEVKGSRVKAVQEVAKPVLLKGGPGDEFVDQPSQGTPSTRAASKPA